MLATALTVVLGTAPVTAFAADVDSTVTEAEQTTPQADTTVKEEVAEPEVKAITVDVTTSSTTFDGTQDIVITYTVNGVQDGFEPYQDIPWFDGHPQDVIEENVSDTVYKFTITKAAQQACIERNNATDGQIFVFDSKYSTGSVDFPTVTLTYTTGDNGGDNGNSNTNNQTTAKPTTAKPTTKKASLKKTKITKKITKKLSSKKVKLTFKKVKGAKKYTVQVSTSKKFKKVLYKKTVKKTKVTLSSKKLKGKKKLYVRVKAVGAKKWSKVVKIKVKK